MDPYTGMMSMGEMDEEKQRAMVESLRRRTSDGGRLSTSSIPEIAQQGALMQKMASSNTGDIGLQEYRKKALKQRDREAALRASTSSKDRNFHKPSGTQTEKFEKAASMVGNISGLANTFKPEYVSSLPLSGGLEEWAGRANLIPSTDTQEEMGAWWSDWKGIYENIQRHELFGSALTQSEKEEWKKSNINSNMDPDVVASKLDVLRRLGEKMSGYAARNAVNKDWDPTYVRDVYEGIIPESAWESRDSLDAYVQDTRNAFAEEPLINKRGQTDLPDMTDEEFMLLLQDRGVQ